VRGSGEVTAQSVAAALGSGDSAALLALCGHIARYEEKEALEALRDMIGAGADTRVLMGDLADVFRRMMWIAAGAAPEEADAPLTALAKAYGKTACVRALDILLRKEYEMRQNLRADIVLETAAMALMAPEDDASAPDIARIEKLEARLAALEARPAAAAAPAVTASAPPAEKTEAKKPKTEKPSAAKASAKDTEAEALWMKVLESLKKDDRGNYAQAKRASCAKLTGDRLEVIFDGNEMSADYLRQDASHKTLEDIASAAAGRPVCVFIISKKKETSDETPHRLFGEDIEEI
jgi:DNA polymerase III gamma/tau subunit